ncbi:MAG TPA: hypothetical protein VGJ17_06865 [Candidatus Limnocylindrales bacterium]
MTIVARGEGPAILIVSVGPKRRSVGPSGRTSAHRARAAEILLAWRETDRRLRAIEPGPEADDLLADLLRLRAEYLSVVDGDGETLRSFPVSDRYLLSS